MLVRKDQGLAFRYNGNSCAEVYLDLFPNAKFFSCLDVVDVTLISII